MINPLMMEIYYKLHSMVRNVKDDILDYVVNTVDNAKYVTCNNGLIQ